MICSKDFLERLLNDEAQFVDKSNINLPEKCLFLATWVIWLGLCCPKFMQPYIS